MSSGNIDGWPPRWLTPVPAAALKASRGPDVCEFIDGYCRVTKDSLGGRAGSLISLRPWQSELIRYLKAVRPDGRLQHRTALIGMARKNAKSTLGAGIGLDELTFGPYGSEIYSCAGDREQARIVFSTAKRMIELEPQLAPLLKPYKDVIENPKTGSIYKVLSAEAFSKEGLNPSLVLFDEVHVQPNRELWDVMALAAGARPEPLMVGITTAGTRYDSSGQDSLCYGLYEYGKRIVLGEIDDPTFFLAWWEPTDPEADHRDPTTWREANPGFDDIVGEEDFVATVKRTPEAEFRTKRCNQWVASGTAWFPAGTWDACADESVEIASGSEVCLGFDGSHNADSTALVVVSCGEKPHVDVVACWEKDPDDPDDWTVPILDVEEAIREACKRWRVREIAADDFRWERTLQVLESEGLPVLTFPQNSTRMGPATSRFYEAVMNRAMTHSGDPRLARHIANAVLKVDPRGARIIKETKKSMRKVDLAVAAVMAFEQASLYKPYNVLDSVW